MKKRIIGTLVALSLATAVVGGPPGPLDGVDIPTDFSGHLAAVQRNSTEFGDYFVFPGALVPGNETDQLLVAKSATKLYVGITGNLDTNGNSWMIGINVPDRTGQTENRSEGSSVCPDGPPWTFQESAREVVIDDNGTPGDTTDDTWAYGVNGMTLPCETDYIFAVDVFAGTIHVNQYTLYDPAGAGAGTWDPTPDNTLDAVATLFATKALVGEGPTNDGDNVLTSAGFGFDEGGFDNTNEDGVTDVDASGAATAITGLELAIPFAAIPTNSGPLTGAETVEVYVILVDGVESSCVGDAYGYVVNQVLPPLATGGPPCDSDPGLIGFRPDLSAVMSCMSVNLSTLHTFGGGDGLADGAVNALDYDATTLATQACPTPYGDQFFDESQFTRGGGSELDALYVTSDAVNLYLGITGNLEENGNRMNIWIDSVPGGDHILSYDGYFSQPGDGMEGDAMPPLESDVNTDALFDYAVSINIGGPPPPSSNVYVDFWDIAAMTSTFKGFAIMESGSGVLDSSGGGSNQWGLQAALNNLNTAGVLGCAALVDLCYFDDIATVEAAAATATSGFEIAIPLADLGLNPCDGPATIHVWAHVTGGSGWRSNQSLPAARPDTGDASEDQVQNAGGDVTDWYTTELGLPERFYRAVAVTHVTTPGIENDCDESGTEDVCDILNGLADDNNFNGIPDSCEGPSCPGGGAEECADTDANNVTDDVCTWWQCDAGACIAVAKAAPSDISGAFGACPLDSFCNIHDANQALACFSGLSTCDAINIDAGGSFGTCPPDGFCNIHDANHALSCFGGLNTCTCPPSPAPQAGPNVVGRTTLALVATQRSVRPGQYVEVQVVTGAMEELQSYQLHAAATGGRRGQLELVDIRIEDRDDFVFADWADAFEAFNLEKGQMLAGLYGGYVAAANHGYLATFTYRASTDAAGTFVIDLLHNEAAGDQTFLIGASPGDKIEIARTKPAVVVVTSAGANGLR